MPLVECVPNFSEGRDRALVEAIVAEASSVPGVVLLDSEMDPDHHRSVVTFAGEPEGVLEAAFRAIRLATQRIDLTTHKGQHPRMGATDVVPFVPVDGVTLEECVTLAKRLGEVPLQGKDLLGALPDDAMRAKALPFADRTPLWFYVLVEAGAQHQGRQLGRVGSRIVMDTLWNLVRWSGVSLLDGDRRDAFRTTLPELLQLAARQD